MDADRPEPTWKTRRPVFDDDATRMPAGVPGEDAVSALARELNREQVEPIDALLDLLSEGEGTPAGLLDGWRGSGAWPPGRWRELTKPDAPVNSPEEVELAVAALVEDKRAAKAAYRPEGSPAARSASLLAYLLAVAAARVRHDRILTTMPAETVSDWLTAVAGAMPARDPLAAVFEEAAARYAGRG